MTRGERHLVSAVFSVCVMVALTLLTGSRASGVSISSSFNRISPSEFLTAPFTDPSTSTVNNYGDFVEVLVSGTGFSLGPDINDAFYGVPAGVPYDSQFYQLNIGWDGFGLAPFSGELHNIDNFITFIEGVGPAGPPATPAYDGVNHTYHFVVSVPAIAGHLVFGVSDGNFGDNGGQYNIQVFQVQPIPEPSTFALLGLGTLSLVAFRRRRREAR
jgi:hypothetical protein